MATAERHAKAPWFPAVLTAMTLLFFARSFSNYFVCDDFQFLDRVNFRNAGKYLSTSWGYGNEYRPFLPYTYALDAAASGSSPIGYHVTNTLLHAGSGLLIAALALLIGLPRTTAALSSAIFILNPAAHEAVLWISGRPVVLSTFLMLACCYLFLKAIGRPGHARWHWLGVYGLFILALGTYELAIVTPALAGFLAIVAKHDRKRYQTPLIVLAVLAGLYALFWNWFFDFRLIRIHVDYSPWRILTNFGEALTHAFHGSRRLEVAAFYFLLLGSLWRIPRGRQVSFMSLAWFVIGYLPYFPIEGYTDRFIYLSSSATAVVLASCLVEGISRKGLQYAAAAILLGFFAVGMQNRITAWKEAGVIAREIPLEIKQQLPEYPPGREVVLLNVPLMHKRSYVFLTSLDRAIERQYPGTRIYVTKTIDNATQQQAIIFEYSNGRMIRRTLEEVLERPH